MPSKKVKIEVLKEKEKLEQNNDQDITFLVRITPLNDGAVPGSRPKLNIGLALDRSGSMSGTKMRDARNAAKFCVDHLLPEDRFSAVIFDQEVDVLFTNRPVANRGKLRAAIDSIEARGSTALHAGWVQGGLQVADGLDSGAINRVLLITDGIANVGETNIGRIVSDVRGLAERNIETSTIGIGADFNEDLLISMAEAGGGNAWHVEEPGDLQRIFGVELNGLIRQVGSDVTLSIQPDAGVRIADVLNDFDRDETGQYRLPNLQRESPIEVVVRMHVPASDAGTKRLATIGLRFLDQETRRIESVEFDLEFEFAPGEIVQALDTNPEVQQFTLLLNNARARREAASRIDLGDTSGAARVFLAAAADAATLYSRSPSSELQHEIEELERLGQTIEVDEFLARKLGMYQEYNRRTGKAGR